MQNRIVAGELRQMRKSLWNLLRLSRGTPHISNYFDHDNLRELANVIAARNAERANASTIQANCLKARNGPRKRLR
jgi:hypothetical protein